MNTKTDGRKKCSHRIYTEVAGRTDRQVVRIALCFLTVGWARDRDVWVYNVSCCDLLNNNSRVAGASHTAKTICRLIASDSAYVKYSAFPSWSAPGALCWEVARGSGSRFMTRSTTVAEAVVAAHKLQFVFLGRFFFFFFFSGFFASRPVWTRPKETA